MTREPPRKPPPLPKPPVPARGAHEQDDSEPSSDRPTVNPPFDVEAYARAATGSGLPGGAAQKANHSQVPTARPPAFEDLDEDPTGRITLTNEVELEKARAQSMSAERSEPVSRGLDLPRLSSSSPLSIANARASSRPDMPAVRRPTPSSIEAAVLGAIGSSEPEITERTIDDPVAEMRDRFSLGDYTGALEIADLLVAQDPDDSEASECGANCRRILENMYAARLGPLDRVPSVIVQRAQLRWLSIDHRAGFVLSLIDGSSTLEMILDVCGMPRLDALRILCELVRQRIVTLDA